MSSASVIFGGCPGPPPRRPCDYCISNLPDDAAPEQLARLARLRWTIELDYRQLKGDWA